MLKAIHLLLHLLVHVCVAGSAAISLGSCAWNCRCTSKMGKYAGVSPHPSRNLETLLPTLLPSETLDVEIKCHRSAALHIKLSPVAGFIVSAMFCIEVGNTDNPCRCKVVGPTLGLIFAILACIICWPCACIIWCCDQKAASRLFEFPLMKGYNGVKNSIPV